MRTVMIIPAGVFQVPAIMKAKELGCRVVTADYLPDNPGHRLADYSEKISILEQDQVLALAQRERVDAVFTMASDLAVKTVGYIAREMGLPEVLPCDNIETICRKHLFRAFQKNNGLPHPRFHVVDSFETFTKSISEIGFPAMVKPSDSSGSKGVFYLNESSYSREDLFNIFTFSRSFSNSGTLCVEQFIDGLEVGGDAFFLNGMIVFYQVTNKYLTPAPLFVPIGHSIPSRLSEGIRERIKDTIQEYASRLGIVDGVVNFDIMVVNDGVQVLEISPRIGGNCIPQVIKYGTGFDTVEAALLLSLGERPKMTGVNSVTPVGSRILGSSKEGFLKSHHSLDVIKARHDVFEVVLDVKVGSKVSRFTEGSCRLGHVICKADSIRELEALLDNIEKELEIRVEDFQENVPSQT